MIPTSASASTADISVGTSTSRPLDSRRSLNGKFSRSGSSGTAKYSFERCSSGHSFSSAAANDGLRAIDPAVTRANLDRLLGILAERGLPVLLAGMVAPPNLGPDYAARFDPIYPELAARHRAILYPFLLDGAAAEAALNQEDGIHPNAAGVEVIAKRMLPSVLCLVRRAEHPAAAAEASGSEPRPESSGDAAGCARTEPGGGDDAAR